MTTVTSSSDFLQSFPLLERLEVLQIDRDLRKLVERGLQVLCDLCRDNVGVGQICRVLQALVLQPENVQADLIAFEQVVVGEGAEPVSFLALMAVLRAIAGDKIIQICAFQRVGFQLKCSLVRKS